MTWEQFLTEKVLHECWHEELRKISNFPGGFVCKNCYKCYLPVSGYRTFDNRNDLMDLYEAVNRDGKIWQFEKVCWEKLKTEFPLKTMEDILNLVTPWMFCLDQKDYEPRCKMVAAFYGWEGEK